jgi:hypothetical protein
MSTRRSNQLSYKFILQLYLAKTEALTNPAAHEQLDKLSYKFILQLYLAKTEALTNPAAHEQLDKLSYKFISTPLQQDGADYSKHFPSPQASRE